jgi:hypothetical protein
MGEDFVIKCLAGFSQSFHEALSSLESSVRSNTWPVTPAGFFLPVIKPFAKWLSNRRPRRSWTGTLDFVRT